MSHVSYPLGGSIRLAQRACAGAFARVRGDVGLGWTIVARRDGRAIDRRDDPDAGFGERRTP